MRIKTSAFLFFSLMTAGIIFLAAAQDSTTSPEDKVKALREAANGLSTLRPDLAKQLNSYADEEAVKNNIKLEPVVTAPKNERLSTTKGRPGIYLYNVPYMSELYVDNKYVGDAKNYDDKSRPLYLNPGNHTVKLRDLNNNSLFDGNVTLEEDGGLVGVR